MGVVQLASGQNSLTLSTADEKIVCFQAGPPPPAFGQQQPSSAQTYFAQPPGAGAVGNLPAPPPAFGRQQPEQAPPASAQWPAYGQQQQFLPQLPPFPPQPQQTSGAGAYTQQWQAPQAQQWGQGSSAQEATPSYTDGSGSQWQQGGSTGYRAWEGVQSQPAHAQEGAPGVLYYPDPAEPLEAPGPEQHTFRGSAEQAVSTQLDWQADAQADNQLQTAQAGWGNPSSSSGQASAAAVVSGAASGHGAQPAAEAAPGLDVSETDFWGLQDGGEDTLPPIASGQTSDSQQPPVGTAEQGEYPQEAHEAGVALSSSQGLGAAEEAGAGGMSAEGEFPQPAGTESCSTSQPQQEQEEQQQQSLWGGTEGLEGYAQASAPEQAFSAVYSQPEASVENEYPEATHEQQPVELESYQQADWNAAQWREQHASTSEYAQPQPQYQPQGDPQWHQQQQLSAAAYEPHQEPSYDYYSQQQQQQFGMQESIPGVTNRAHVPFTPSPRTPSFHQPPAASWGSQIRHQSAADAGLVPGTAAEGTRVTHGKPPCAVIAWGFGGRCAVVRPRMQGVTLSSAAVPLHVLELQEF